MGHAHAPGLHRRQQRPERRPEQVSGGDAEGRSDEAGHGVGHVDDEGAPPQGRGCGNKAEHEARDHLPPSVLGLPQVVLHDEGEPHPAQDEHQNAGGDGPHDRPRLPRGCR